MTMHLDHKAIEYDWFLGNTIANSKLPYFWTTEINLQGMREGYYSLFVCECVSSCYSYIPGRNRVDSHHSIVNSVKRSIECRCPFSQWAKISGLTTNYNIFLTCYNVRHRPQATHYYLSCVSRRSYRFLLV